MNIRSKEQVVKMRFNGAILWIYWISHTNLKVLIFVFVGVKQVSFQFA